MKPEAITLSLDDRRLLALWAADCAEQVLPLFEAIAPPDVRPREAIAAARVFGNGGTRTKELSTRALAALAAAREGGDPIATAAARSAGFAASTAYTKALAGPHHAKHALGPGMYAALAWELAAGGTSQAAGAAEEMIRWAIEHASPGIRGIVCRWPARIRGRSRMDALYYQLDSGLRHGTA